ncbi:MAG: tetratricopeptide repeat protein [Treponema sp.]|nr:tetratricopeptide repeat protein [Treponema sp.]
MFCKNLKRTVFFFSLVPVILSGCQSSKQEDVVVANSLSTNYEKTDNVPVPKDAVVIKVNKNDGAYFSAIDQGVYNDFCTGSPSSIRHGINTMHKAMVDYTEKESALYNIGNQIFSYVWKSEKPLENVPEISKKNYYMALFTSAQQGQFDSAALVDKTKKDDFFSLVIPAVSVLSDAVNPINYPEIEQCLTAALKIQSKSVLCWYLLGVLYQKQQLYDKAIAAFDRSFSDGLIIYEVQLAKARCYIEQKRYDKVQNVLSTLVIQYPSDTRILKLYAQTAYLTGNYQDAQQYALLVLQQNPSDLEFVLFRAKVFVTTGEYLKASSLLDVYAKTNPQAKDYLLLRSRVQKEWNKNLSAAFATIENALSRYPDDSEVIIYAATIASETGGKINGKTGGELADLILERDPDNRDALKVAVSSLYAEGNYTKAYALSQKLVSLSPGQTEVVSQHIRICLALKNSEEAWKYASSIYERNPSDLSAIQMYIEVMVASGRTGQAGRLINQLLPNANSSSMKSFLYYQRSFLAPSESAALGDLRSSLIANPRNSDALLRMYHIYFNKKDYRKAQYYLKQVVALNPNEDKYLKLNAELDALIR